MEHFIRMSFWIFTFLTCLDARCLPLVDSNIKYMRSHVTCPQDSRFYAPTNVMVECIATALDCVMRELNGTVRQECNDPLQYIEPALDFLDLKIEDHQGQNHAPPESSGCQCEKWSQAPFGEFLDKMESLLQLEYAACVE